MNQILVPRTKVYVETQEYCYNSYHSGEQYGDWSEELGYEVVGVKLSQEGYEDCFDLGESVQVGEEVHVVYIIYEDGDSFGRRTGRGELVWVFKDRELAKKAVSKIYEENGKENYAYSIEIELGKNRTMKWSNPAAGYFESLTDVDIKSFLVKP